MLIKLAVKNIRQSFRDYTVYFLTLLLAIVLFYVFNSIGDQTGVLQANEQQQFMLAGLSNITNILSVFIAFVLGFLILYANRFLMKRRSKELGIYLLLGMKRSKVSTLFMIETFLIGLISLISGLMIGFYASQAMGVLAGKLLNIPVGPFRFIFSPRAFWMTLISFVSLFGLVGVFNITNINRLKLIELIQAGRRISEIKPRSAWGTVLIFLISVTTLGLAYAMIIASKFNPLSPLFLLSIILGSVGTYFFFEGFSGFLVRLMRRFPGIYYRNLNMVTVRLVNSRLRITKWLMSVVTILLLLTIGSLFSGFNISSSIQEILNQEVPEVQIVLFDHTDAAPPILAEPGFIDLIEQRSDVRLYNTGLRIPDLEQAGFKFGDMMGQEYFVLSAISQTDYLELSDYYEIEQPVLASDQVYLIGNAQNHEMYQMPEEYNLTLGDQVLVGNTERLAYVQATTDQQGLPILVVPDEIVSSLDPSLAYINLKAKDVALAEPTKQLNASNPDAMVHYREQVISDIYSISGAAIFITLYLGLIFLISALALLALQQLSENQDNRNNYHMLR